MDAAEHSDLNLDELRERWLDRLDQNLEAASFDTGELAELARRYRTFAGTTASSGQRRAAHTIAERLERAARDRVATSG